MIEKLKDIDLFTNRIILSNDLNEAKQLAEIIKSLLRGIINERQDTKKSNYHNRQSLIENRADQIGFR